jgi:polysaccharide biosynthesis protein PslH
MTALLLTTKSPYPVQCGATRRLHDVAKAVSGNHDRLDLVVISFGIRNRPLRVESAEETPYSTINHLQISLLFAVFSLLRALVHRDPLQVGLFKSAYARIQLQKIFKQITYTRLVCHLVRTVSYADIAPQGVRISVELTDMISQNYLRQAKALRSQSNIFRHLKSYLYQNEGKWLYNFETRCATIYDDVYLVSKRDVEALLTAVPETDQKSVKLAPLCLKEGWAKTGPALEKVAIFNGKLNYLPNFEALVFLIEDVWPLVLLREPEAQLLIIGSGASASFQAKTVKLLGSSVKFTGFVNDLHANLSQARCILAPIFTGAGTQNKILDAMQMGLPVVTTAFGRQGLQNAPNTALLTAEDPDAFAEHVCAMLYEFQAAQKQGEEGYEYVQQSFGISKLTDVYR